MLKHTLLILVLACPRVSVAQTQPKPSGKTRDHEQAIRANYKQSVDAELAGDLKKRDDITVSNISFVSADTAVATGSSRSAGAYKGDKFEHSDAFTDVFVRRDGKWVCVASHWSRLPDAPKK